MSKKVIGLVALALIVAFVAVFQMVNAAPSSNMTYNAFQRLGIRNEASLNGTRIGTAYVDRDYPVVEVWNPSDMSEGWACIIYNVNKSCGWAPYYIGEKSYGQVVFNVLVITADPTLGYPYGWGIIK